MALHEKNTAKMNNTLKAGTMQHYGNNLPEIKFSKNNRTVRRGSSKLQRYKIIKRRSIEVDIMQSWYEMKVYPRTYNKNCHRSVSRTITWNRCQLGAGRTVSCSGRDPPRAVWVAEPLVRQIYITSEQHTVWGMNFTSMELLGISYFNNLDLTMNVVLTVKVEVDAI